MASRKLVGAAIMILPWPLFLLAAKGFGFVATWMLIVTLVISAYGLTLLISPAAPSGNALSNTPQPDDSPIEPDR